MTKNIIFAALMLLFFTACTDQQEVPPEVSEGDTILLKIAESLDYQPGKTFEAANVVRLASGEVKAVSIIEMSDKHWTRMESGQWIVAPGSLEEELAFEYLDTYDGEEVVEQVIRVYEVIESAGKTDLPPLWSIWCRDMGLNGWRTCMHWYGVLTTSATCPCMALCYSEERVPLFNGDLNSVIYIPCR